MVTTGPARSGTLRRSLALALALFVSLPASGLSQEALKTNRRFLFGLGFGIGVAIPAYVFTSEDAFQSGCSSKSCVALVAGLIGGTIGFLIGAEMDSRYARRMAAGPSLDYTFQDVPLDLVPDHIAGFPGGAAVAGLGGARIVFRDGTVQRRGAGVRGIEDVVVLPEQELLVLSTFSNLIAFPVENDSLQGQVVDERGGGSMGVFQNRLAVAGLDSLRLLRLQRVGRDISVETESSIENLAFITDISFSDFGRIGWVLREDRLAAYTGDLEMLGEFVLPAAGRTVRAHGGRLAVAAGTHGVFVLDVTDPGAPEVVLQYNGVRFAYAAELDGDLLYVAAGPEGVAVVDISGPEPSVVGIARRPRFVTDVVVGVAGEVWILDRDGRRVQIADFDAETAVSRAVSGH